MGKLERPCTSHLPELAWMRSLLSIAGSAGTVWQPLSQDLHPPGIFHHRFAAILHDPREGLAALSL